MADKGKVVIHLATGLEDPERVTVAFLVGGAAVDQGKRVVMFLTKEAVRLAQPGFAEAVACDGCPATRAAVPAACGRRRRTAGLPEMRKARGVEESNLVPNARLAGATSLWEWIGDDGATVFRY